MGYHRLSVKITLTGITGETKELDWWVNWWPDKPEKLYKELVSMAVEAGLDVEDKTYLFGTEQ